MAKHSKKEKAKKGYQSLNAKKKKARKHFAKKFLAIITSLCTILGAIYTIANVYLPEKTPKNSGDNIDIGTNYGTVINGNNYVYGEDVSDLSQANEYYNQGQEFFRMGNYENALSRYEDAWEEYKSNAHAKVDKARIQYAIGLTYKRYGNLDKAIEWYTDAIGTLNSSSPPKSDEIDDELGYVHYLRGNAYLENRDLERALLDCENCFKYLDKMGFGGKYTYASVLCLKGRIYTSSYYGTHSPYPVHGGVDLDVSWLDAMDCFDEALGWNGMRLRTDMGDGFPSDTVAVKSFQDIELSGMVLVSKLGEMKIPLGNSYWIIENPDVETATILNYRSTLLLMMGESYAVYLDEAELNSNIALQIYNDLPADQREGIQDIYYALALITLTRGATENENGTISPTVKKNYCELLEQAQDYTQRWCGKSKSTAVACENMGYGYLITGDYDSAEMNFQEARHIFEELGLTEDVTKANEFLECVEVCRDNPGEWSMEKIHID